LSLRQQHKSVLHLRSHSLNLHSPTQGRQSPASVKVLQHLDFAPHSWAI
jgi:hypothetical protein